MYKIFNIHKSIKLRKVFQDWKTNNLLTLILKLLQTLFYLLNKQ